MKLRTVIALTISLYTSNAHVMQPKVNNESYISGFIQGSVYTGAIIHILHGAQNLQHANNLSRALNNDRMHASLDGDAMKIVRKLEAQGIHKILLGSTAIASLLIYNYLQPNSNVEK